MQSTAHVRRRRRAGHRISASDERRLIERYRRHGDLRAREQLVERFLPLARHLARRYERRGQPLEDLVQAASVGLVKAVDRFDPERGHAFSTYAVPNILGELRRHLRNSGWALHVPRPVQELALRVENAVDTCSSRLGRSPTVDEVASTLEVSGEEVLEAREAAAARRTRSLDVPADPEDDSATVLDAVGELDSGYDFVEDMAVITRALRALPERDRLVLLMRFRDELTQAEIAERIGVSQMHVSRILRGALERVATIARGPRRR